MDSIWRLGSPAECWGPISRRPRQTATHSLSDLTQPACRQSLVAMRACQSSPACAQCMQRTQNSALATLQCSPGNEAVWLLVAAWADWMHPRQPDPHRQICRRYQIPAGAARQRCPHQGLANQQTPSHRCRALSSACTKETKRLHCRRGTKQPDVHESILHENDLNER